MHKYEYYSCISIFINIFIHLHTDYTLQIYYSYLFIILHNLLKHNLWVWSFNSIQLHNSKHPWFNPRQCESQQLSAVNKSIEWHDARVNKSTHLCLFCLWDYPSGWLTLFQRESTYFYSLRLDPFSLLPPDTPPPSIPPPPQPPPPDQQ